MAVQDSKPSMFSSHSNNACRVQYQAWLAVAVVILLKTATVSAAAYDDSRTSRDVLPVVCSNVRVVFDKRQENVRITGMLSRSIEAVYDYAFLNSDDKNQWSFGVKTAQGLSTTSQKIDETFTVQSLKIENSKGETYPLKTFIEFVGKRQPVLIKYHGEELDDAFAKVLSPLVPVVTIPLPLKSFPELVLDKSQIDNRMLRDAYFAHMASLNLPSSRVGTKRSTGDNYSQMLTRAMRERWLPSYENKGSDHIVPWLLKGTRVQRHENRTTFAGTKIVPTVQYVPYPVLTIGGESGVIADENGQKWLLRQGQRVEVRYFPQMDFKSVPLVSIEASVAFPSGQNYPLDELEAYLGSGNSVFAVPSFQIPSKRFLGMLEPTVPIIKLKGPTVEEFVVPKVYSAPEKFAP